MLAELLKKWVELAPKECSTKDGEYFCLDVGNLDEIDSVLPDEDFCLLQDAVQTAIVDRNLRCRIENDENGWYAVIQREDFPLVLQTDKECAVALLKAYISYLEGQKAAAPT